MAWLAVDKDGTECIFNAMPVFDESDGAFKVSLFYAKIKLPSGSIKKLIGRELTWEDEPVEI